MKYRKLIIICAGMLLFLAMPLKANAADLEELKQKIQAIQEENRALQEKLKKQETMVLELTQRLEALEQQGAGAAGLLGEQIALPTQDIPRMTVKGFGDIGFRAEKADNRSAASAGTFAVGEFDFIITSEISDNVSFFNETLIELEESETEIDVERLYLKYNLSDWFNVMFGRYHTPLGYWNTTFHHGTWFQTTVSRPLVTEYEHDGGFLPMHGTGVNFFGRQDMGWFDLGYDLGISNGRDNIVSNVQDVQDKNDAKAVAGQLSFSPHGLVGLTLGVNGYADKIPALPSTAGRNNEIREIILGGYAIYQTGKLAILSEGYNIDHHDEVSGQDYETTGLYLQAGYKLKDKYTPYYRFDLLDFGRGDPYFSGIDVDNEKHTIGLRWDVSTWNALKLELSYSDRKNAADIGEITLNDSFHF